MRNDIGLTTRQVAAILGVPVNTLAKAVYDGRIRRPGELGHTFVWGPADVHEAAQMLSLTSPLNIMGVMA